MIYLINMIRKFNLSITMKTSELRQHEITTKFKTNVER